MSSPPETTKSPLSFTVRNPTDQLNEAHWAAALRAAGRLRGRRKPPDPKCVDIKLARSFIFLEGKLARAAHAAMGHHGSLRARPGLVPEGVPRTDVNPRPLSSLVPSNGLIGCFSEDAQWLFAMAFEPYQELFQGVAQMPA